MKKIFAGFITILGIVWAFLLPQTFIYSGILTKFLDSFMHLRINPRFTGGEVISTFLDPLGDDTGDGRLTYPTQAAFDQKGTLDLVRYTVHKPLPNANWNELTALWQLELTFDKVGNPFDARKGFSHPSIHIYIDLDGTNSGSLRTFNPRSEMVEFDENHPWDLMVNVNGFDEDGKIVSADKTYSNKVKVYFSELLKTVIIQIPLTDPIINRALDGRPTYHYVLIGAYDPYTRGNFMSVKPEASIHNGGGAISEFTPRVYDYLAPKGMKQITLLSAYDATNMIYAKIYPVTVQKSTNAKRQQTGDLAQYEKAAKEEQALARTNSILRVRAMESSNIAGFAMAEAYFNAGMIEPAEKTFDAILTSDPSNAVAIAYRGSIYAMKGGSSSSLGDAVAGVQKALEYFDKAERLAKNDQDLIYILMNRGSVSIAVPDSVFNQAKRGAKSFLKVAEILERSDGSMQVLRINALLNAAIAFEIAGLPGDADIYFNAVSEMTNLSAAVKLELMRRGY